MGRIERVQVPQQLPPPLWALVGEVGAAKLRREGGDFHELLQNVPPSLPLPHKGGGNEFVALET